MDLPELHLERVRAHDGGLVPGLDTSDPVTRAWVLAIRIVSDPTYLPTLEQLMSLATAGDDASRACARAAVTLASRSAQSLSIGRVRSFYEFLRGAEPEGDPFVAIGRQLIAAWHSWLSGTPIADAQLAEIAERARAERLGGFLVEAQSLRALHALERGEVDTAARLARRSMRMAQAERLAEAEILAHLTLARVRRYQGQVHLAARISAALVSYAPAYCRRWVWWERWLCAVDDDPVLEALRVGDAHQLNAAFEPILALDLPAPCALERAAAVAMIGETGSWSHHTAWRRGMVAQVDPEFSGIALGPDMRANAAAPATAYLLLGPDLPVRRIARVSRELEAQRYQADDALALDAWQARLDQGLAVLAWSASPLLLEDYFRRTFLMDLEPSVHRGLLNQHVLRLRARVGERAAIVREERTLQLVPRRRIILRDPTCMESTEQRVLRVLGAGRGVSAADVARELRLPTRTTQRILRELVDESLTVSRREGRAVVYDVEDTSFSEPTTTRMRAWLGNEGGAR